MSFVAVDKDGSEWIYEKGPIRRKTEECWWDNRSDYMLLPKGSIEKPIGRKLTWEDESVELEEEPKEDEGVTIDNIVWEER